MPDEPRCARCGKVYLYDNETEEEKKTEKKYRDARSTWKKIGTNIKAHVEMTPRVETEVLVEAATSTKVTVKNNKQLITILNMNFFQKLLGRSIKRKVQNKPYAAYQLIKY